MEAQRLASPSTTVPNLSGLAALETPSSTRIYNGIPSPEPSSDSHSESEIPKDKEQAVDHIPVKSRSRSSTKTSSHEGVRRLSASKIQELTAAPESLPIATLPDYPLSATFVETSNRPSMPEHFQMPNTTIRSDIGVSIGRAGRPTGPRTVSTPPAGRRQTSSQPPSQASHTRRNSFQPGNRPAPLELDGRTNFVQMAPHSAQQPSARSELPEPQAMPPTVPLPPMSIPTVLQLELAGQRPSPLYIHHSYASDLPYESSAIKFERLKYFLQLPFFLERTLHIGALACLDAWLWTFTILPMRFCLALGVLIRWWAYVVGKEVRWLLAFVWHGLGRLWKRGQRGRALSRTTSYDSTRTENESRSPSRSRETNGSTHEGNGTAAKIGLAPEVQLGRRRENSAASARPSPSLAPPKKIRQGSSVAGGSRHRRTKSMPSNLTSFHKADLLQGAVIIFSSIALMNLDASRMYHFVRAQSAMKLYVIYNVLEVLDRLLGALGQDIFQCLFSSETLSRNSSGRSKIMLPLGMFLLALTYNIAHAVTLFYQVITLNVAVNSYSNALLSLLISNQFVEIKSSVFKRFEKENVFQLTCADIVERFQLWVMLLIIGLRNVVEVGGLSVPGAGTEMGGEDGGRSVPLHTSSVLPASFTILPVWFFSGEVLSPFLVVIGSEMIVDSIKHAYINKFNNIKPNFYGRVLDILCKDYYTNAFVTPSLTRRLGLPLLPLSTLFIRASVQTYNMFLATHVSAPLPPSTQTSLSVESSTPTSPAIKAALNRLDTVIRNALGRSVYGDPSFADVHENGTAGAAAESSPLSWFYWTSDDVIAALTMVVVFLLVFLVLLTIKLLLGMALLRYSRNRYSRMKATEHAIATGKAERESVDIKSKRVGGFGHIEVGEERKRWIYADDPDGMRKSKERERKNERNAEKEKDLNSVMRYEMVAKRIW
ncbi:DUF747-domain-containing protein [Thozetella sp. PMI_491]|nr:DUF747-domain-containing protein [Thozetella sp. PMI_491]